jgi:hypothetical protein
MTVSLAASVWLGDRAAQAQSLPPSGRYQCAGPNGAMNDLTFTVGPGNIYTSRWGWRGVLNIHPVTGNILFIGKSPENAYEGRYSPGPPPQVTLLTVNGATSTESGIVCQVH